MKPSVKSGVKPDENTCQSATTTVNVATGIPLVNPTCGGCIEMFIPGEPVPKGSMRQVARGVMVHDNPKLRRWSQTIQLVAKQAYKGAPIDAPVHVEATFYLPRPKRPRFTVPAVKPDCDKLQRALGDGLENSGVLANDSRIVAWSTRKAYADAAHPEGAHVKIKAVG